MASEYNTHGASSRVNIQGHVLASLDQSNTIQVTPMIVAVSWTLWCLYRPVEYALRCLGSKLMRAQGTRSIPHWDIPKRPSHLWQTAIVTSIVAVLSCTPVWLLGLELSLLSIYTSVPVLAANLDWR